MFNLTGTYIHGYYSYVSEPIATSGSSSFSSQRFVSFVPDCDSITGTYLQIYHFHSENYITTAIDFERFILFSFKYLNDNNLIRCTIARTDKNVQITILIPIFFFFYLPWPMYRKQAPDVWRSLLSNCIALIFLNLPSSCSAPQPLPWQ